MNRSDETSTALALPVLPARAGVFGKLPARADFVARGLPRGFSDPWHAWLVRGLAAAREALGPGFEAAYMAAPVWRFLLQPGACGPEAAAGVLLPSVDAADRLFPLTIAAIADGLDLPAIRGLESWFEALEDAGREALAEDTEFEAWLARVAALPTPPSARKPAPPGAPGPAAPSPAESGVVLWSDGSPYVAATALAFAALPEGAGFVQLLANPTGAREDAP